jgi:acetyltransferase-like isoleucine patch superfamily enzyme
VIKIVVSLFALVHLFWLRFIFSTLSSAIRVQSLRLRGAVVGNKVTIRPFVIFSGCKNIVINDGVFIGEYGVISATDSHVSIGANTLIGPKC